MEINNLEKLLEKIHSSLERIALALEKQAKVFEEQNYYEDENASTTPASDTNDVFDKIKSADERKFAEDLVNFVKNECPDEDYWANLRTSLFWADLGISSTSYGIPSDLKLKIERIERLAEKMFITYINEKRSDIKKKEAPLIDEMSVECANWAKNNHLKNVTKQDVELFLHEHETELSPQGQRLLWTKSKFRLRGD
ncbi:MAG TPA: hypothetical protein VJH88_00125 [Candidatus Nanoarchaeia archaeon]|nr:hypothetical protein [Candidatus Nanoarchaeia archaeon]